MRVAAAVGMTADYGATARAWQRPRWFPELQACTACALWAPQAPHRPTAICCIVLLGVSCFLRSWIIFR